MNIWVFSGGGMKCAWSAGALYELGRRGIAPDMIVAASGSAGSAAYFVAHQYESIKNIWCNILPDNTSFRSGFLIPTLNIDYLVDDVFTRIDPLDTSRLRRSGINLVIPAVEKSSSHIHYFRARDCNDTVLRATLKATKKVPLFAGGAVEIGGAKYHDSMISSFPQLHVHRLRSMYPDARITVFTTLAHPNSARLEELLYIGTRAFSRHRRQDLALLREAGRSLTNVTTIAPGQNIHTGLFSRNMFDTTKPFIDELFELGRDDAQRFCGTLATCS